MFFPGFSYKRFQLLFCLPGMCVCLSLSISRSLALPLSLPWYEMLYEAIPMARTQGEAPASGFGGTGTSEGPES